MAKKQGQPPTRSQLGMEAIHPTTFKKLGPANNAGVWSDPSPVEPSGETSALADLAVLPEILSPMIQPAHTNSLETERINICYFKLGLRKSGHLIIDNYAAR